MVRKFTLLALLVLTTQLFAGSGGPDAYGYTWKDNFEPDGPLFEWIDITTMGVQVTGLGDDNIVGPYVMETNMPFYWYNRKNVWIGSNGYIAFTNGNIASPFPVIPAVGGTNDYITGMMADLNFAGVGNPGQVWWYDDTGVTIITYLNVPFWSPAAPSYTGSNSFQIILNKQDGSILVNVLSQTGSTQNNDITIGIESVAGSIGLQHSKNIYPGANYAILYEPPVVPLITVSDVTVAWNSDETSGGRFLSRNGAAFNMVTNVKNIGNEPVGGFTVTGTILNAANQVQVNDQTTVGNLVPEQESTIYFGPTWAPNLAGTFRFRSTVSGIAGELVTTNNQRIQELVVVDTTSLTHELRFHGATDDGLGLSWSGGNGGVGTHFIPPYHPAMVTHSTVRIVANTGNSGFYMKLYADDGPDGSAGTLLDSVFVPPAQAFVGDHVVPLSAPVTITSGGVYLLWYMAGINISIAQDISAPFSLRTYEVLDGTWAEYRDRENVDFFLGLRLMQMPVVDVGCDGFFGLENGEQITGPTAVRTFIRNLGNQPVSNIPVRFRYGTGSITEQTYTGTDILPGQQVLFTFSTFFNPTEDGIGDLCAWTEMPGDNSATNDTTCVSVETITGIAERTTLELRVSPNPSRDLVRIEGLPPGTYALRLFDATGRELRSTNVVSNGHPITLPVNGLAEGAYHLLVMDGFVRASSTIVVRH